MSSLKTTEERDKWLENTFNAFRDLGMRLRYELSKHDQSDNSEAKVKSEPK